MGTDLTNKVRDLLLFWIKYAFWTKTYICTVSDWYTYLYVHITQRLCFLPEKKVELKSLFITIIIEKNPPGVKINVYKQILRHLLIQNFEGPISLW